MSLPCSASPRMQPSQHARAPGCGHRKMRARAGRRTKLGQLAHILPTRALGVLARELDIQRPLDIRVQERTRYVKHHASRRALALRDGLTDEESHCAPTARAPPHKRQGHGRKPAGHARSAPPGGRRRRRTGQLGRGGMSRRPPYWAQPSAWRRRRNQPSVNSARLHVPLGEVERRGESRENLGVDAALASRRKRGTPKGRALGDDEGSAACRALTPGAIARQPVADTGGSTTSVSTTPSA